MVKILFFCLLIISGPLYASSPKRVWNLVSLEWPPHSCSQCEDQGIAIKIIKELFNAAGEELRITFLPWSRAKRDFYSEKFDLVYPIWRWEYQKLGAMETPKIYSSPLMLYYKPESPEPFCLVHGYNYGDQIHKHIGSRETIDKGIHTDEQCLKLMASKRSSGAILDQALLAEKLAQHPELRNWPAKLFDSGDLFIAYHPKDSAFFKKTINPLLKKLGPQLQKRFDDFIKQQNQK